MDKIPESLMQVLDVVNKGSNSGMHNVSLQKKYIEEEADCILNLSAQMKQVVLDLLPDSEFDQDFTDAYMEPLEESDDGSSDEDFMDSDYEAESVGDFAPFELSSFYHYD
ncbi:hypothetical protein SESBI_15948 [Sesbania bispinosa]|nr:hypothetical protein SESBI_15948 [Sesbania bispinosa]